MWEERSPRQIYELFKTYKDMTKPNKEPENKEYTVKGQNTKIPEWLKDRIPKGSIVYNADEVTQGQL